MTMIPVESLVPADLRKSLRASLASLPNRHANENADQIADLVFLAVTDAMTAIDRVASRSANAGVGMAVLSGTSSTLRAVLERLEDAIIAYAKAEGGDVFRGSVTIGGGGDEHPLDNRA